VNAAGGVARTSGERPAEGTPLLVRLPSDWRLPGLPPPLPVAAPVVAALEALPFDWADATSAAIGTVAHRLLAQVAGDGLAAWTSERARAQSRRIVAELAAEGVDVDLRDAAAARVVEVVVRTLQDPRGRWLFDPAHDDARSEWALAGVDDGRVVHVVLDRSFVADGVRYVVDFKTGSHQGGDRATFLARERERYGPQLARYARIVRALDDRYPVRIALYHPLVEDGWQEEAAP
jgi:ATP-dependent exoDNAse (exonuclease V) beta subunit